MRKRKPLPCRLAAGLAVCLVMVPLATAPRAGTDTGPDAGRTVVEASYEAGKSAYDAKDYTQALLSWSLAAAEGDAQALNGLGLLYANGFGVVKDPATALQFYRQAAERGLDRAQYNLARMLEKGIGTEPDPQAALEWYYRAAEQGYDRGQLAMGIAHVRGELVTKDQAVARQWYLLAANNGNRAAQFNLGTMLRDGRGGPADRDAARGWFLRAALQGYGLAQLRLGNLIEQDATRLADDIDACRWYILADRAGQEKAAPALERLSAAIGLEAVAAAEKMADGFAPVPEPRNRDIRWRLSLSLGHGPRPDADPACPGQYSETMSFLVAPRTGAVSELSYAMSLASPLFHPAAGGCTRIDKTATLVSGRYDQGRLDLVLAERDLISGATVETRYTGRIAPPGGGEIVNLLAPYEALPLTLEVLE